MFAGISISIDNVEYVIPPLSLGQLRNGALTLLKEHDILLAEGKTFETMDLRGKIILQALRRNYPEFDEKQLFDYLDLGNILPMWNAVLGISGFPATLGETPAVMPTGVGTSSPSTEASPPLMDGPIRK
jgi:hypothetical protein